MILNQQPYTSNIRDSSVSNNSSHAGSSSLAAYNKNQARGSQSNSNQFGMMNNFMSSNLQQAFYQNSRGPDGYNYDINLNAVNKSLNGQTQNAVNNRSGSQKSQDYDNNPKSIYMNKSNSIQQRKQQIDNKNNVIMEMDAENNEDESYYMSNSPVRKNNNTTNRTNANGAIRNNGLSANASNFGGVELNQAGNQQNQQYQNHQYSPTSGGLNMNGGKSGHGKKSNNHINTAGYSQILKSNTSSGQNTMTGFAPNM